MLVAVGLNCLVDNEYLQQAFDTCLDVIKAVNPEFTLILHNDVWTQNRLKQLLQCTLNTNVQTTKIKVWALDWDYAIIIAPEKSLISYQDHLCISPKNSIPSKSKCIFANEIVFIYERIWQYV